MTARANDNKLDVRGHHQWASPLEDMVTHTLSFNLASRLPEDFPDDESMRISHEAIYQALFIQGRGALPSRFGGLVRYYVVAAAVMLPLAPEVALRPAYPSSAPATLEVGAPPGPPSWLIPRRPLMIARDVSS